MSNVENMLATFTIILLVTNAVILAFTFLPSNVDASDYYDFGFTTEQKNQLTQSVTGVIDDANAIIGDVNSNVTASTTEVSTQNLLDQLLSGFGKAVDTVISGASTTISLIAAIIKYLFYLLFGYVFWIDYFLAPLSGLGTISGFFVSLGWGLKALFFIIQIVGFASIIVPIFTGGRR